LQAITPDFDSSQGDKGTIYVVEEQANPSTDYFVLPAVSAPGLRVVRCGFADLPAVADLVGASVVFVRYVPKHWVRLIEAVRPQLRRLAFFMDDDVLDVRASAGMPLRYRLKLARLAAWRVGWLRRQGAELWVSTPWLLQKYVSWQPSLVPPSPVSQAENVRRVFYHGSASHAAEIRWLRPVMEETLRRDEQLVFEIVGGGDVYRMYRGMPRVNVVHPMKWPAYQAFLSMPGRHVGLVPLLDVPFNRARSCTKFFDITRCGAVGIYSPHGACAELVCHEVDGLVVPLEQSAWVEAILRLARDEPLRQTLLLNAQEKQGELGDKARTGYSGLRESQ
jgi:glycosyltransferase involved in cell wall biosynthesis